ncbi:MAG: DNA translocase FtsK 4TM domain-containing protein [Bacteroidales bacterium]|nr:DNA translocase FtsK 4TM domain-containing protein [Bacteroidales bacterium]
MAKRKTKDDNSYKKDIKSKSSSDESFFKLLSNAVRSEAFLRISGLFLILVSLFLLFSFVSFFITWFKDYNIISNATPIEIIKGDKNIQNWGGSLGAYLAYVLISKTFGISSFGYLYILVILGLRLFSLEFKFRKHLITVILAMLWLSSLTGYLVYNLNIERFEMYSGAVGMALNSWLDGVIGRIGAGLLLFFATIILPMILFGVRYSFLRKIRMPKRKIKEKREEVPPIVEVKDIPPTPSIEMPIVNEEEPIPFIKRVENKIEKPKKEEKDIEFEVEVKQSLVLDSQEEDLLEMEVREVKRNGIDTLYDPREDLPDYKFPPIDFLINYEERNLEVKQEELLANKNRIVETLKNYNIDISKIVATPGPTVTLYEIVPAPGIRISKIKNLEDDIALSLSALGIRIIAPIPGRGTIGIEVPNQNPQIVSMRGMLSSSEFRNSKFDLPIAIGRTISNTPFVADLAKMPHLLMAGATGQGKSVGLNAIISSLLYRKHPAELKFVMVDPKKVELSLYTKIERHFLAKLPDAEDAIITDVRKVVRTLNSLCIEMDQRYDLLKEAQVKNIKEYNSKFISRKLNPEKGHRYLPYIVLVIDEFADLIMTAGKEIEMPIARLAQLARAIGIHLIIATQRPSVNIITGIIKANFPARVAFRVTSKIDSRTILDMGGADQLIGRGDLLLSTGNDLIRLQCALIDTEEIEKMADYIGSQRAYSETFLLPEYLDENSEPSKEIDPRQIDEKFAEAARIIVALQHGSTSVIQRKLSLGYNRAGRIIDQLEAAGIVGAFEGSKAREVKVKTEAELEEILREFHK